MPRVKKMSTYDNKHKKESENKPYLFPGNQKEKYRVRKNVLIISII